MTEAMTADVDTDAVAKKDPARQPADGVDAELVGRLVEHSRAAGLQLTGEGGLLQQLTRLCCIERWHDQGRLGR